MVGVACDLCGQTPVEPVGVGEDFEYWTSPDSFLAVRCTRCGLVFLDPRPDESELGRIYPPEYHAFDFSEERFGLVHRVRERLEARRLLRWTRRLGPQARILDVGCGDGFHLDLLRRYGSPTWTVEGVEPDERAARAAGARGLTVHASVLGDAPIEPSSVDLVILIQTIEHVPEPQRLLSQIARVLRPGGRLVVVTDNVGSPDYRIFRSRHWGGWHFPRHWHLYSRDTLGQTGRAAGLEVVSIETQVSPVNWVYSVRNLLVDLGVPHGVTRHLSLESPVALAAGTVVDTIADLAGRGALLRATFAKPATAPTSTT
jgi:SAM-dependent methyltransferase